MGPRSGLREENCGTFYCMLRLMYLVARHPTQQLSMKYGHFFIAKYLRLDMRIAIGHFTKSITQKRLADGET